MALYALNRLSERLVREDALLCVSSRPLSPATTTGHHHHASIAPQKPVSTARLLINNTLWGYLAGLSWTRDGLLN
ncbi:hypothetical protein H257_01060 [Aphanomyces astaci]|uniref:Uncharacterized protein n=1 Tax=Aphanomyces astaci TaxID=112090 RepID=W4H6J3_APHAT|nr:hypothetical protein H257_01060 [Aphanomyces astaci]ETV87517.1 hypothetical protein H257_01060 [Aphanomyces astaci]|eukprot:XP_009822380.1 hypothetical protein H257_01060 [Aphanomyces astaci]